MEASAKKHEAIETDILAYEERVLAVVAVAEELQTENYHDIERINARSARRPEGSAAEKGGQSGGGGRDMSWERAVEREMVRVWYGD